jgi:hypothetical protein
VSDVRTENTIIGLTPETMLEESFLTSDNIQKIDPF